jgi:hypothetical protein
LALAAGVNLQHQRAQLNCPARPDIIYTTDDAMADALKDMPFKAVQVDALVRAPFLNSTPPKAPPLCSLRCRREICKSWKSDSTIGCDQDRYCKRKVVPVPRHR